jgi:hypothetical protein
MNEEEPKVSKYRHKPEYFLAYAELLAAARRRGTVTYREIAFVTGLPMRWPRMLVEVGDLVGEISKDEHLMGRPMLSALAVHEDNGRPGKGFFGLAKGLKQLKDDSEQGKQRFWEQQKASIYRIWRKKPLV